MATRNELSDDALSALRSKMQTVHERLCAAYECPIPHFRALDPLSELIWSLLSHRTKNADSGRAYRALRERYVDWQAVRDAPIAEIEALIAPVTWPEQKAPRIRQVLDTIFRECGELNLGFLGTMPVPDARAWLEALPGVGPKTSAAVLNFSHLRKAALPVDSHHHRVAERLGFLPLGMAVGASHAFLENLLPPDADAEFVYDNHEVFMLHGQRCCFFRAPNCSNCPVLDICPTGQRNLAKSPVSIKASQNDTSVPLAERPVDSKIAR